MLSQEDNELITRVGPGTAMGNLMRQYWIPACLSNELPSADCPPLRVRLLCENLIAFRATSGNVGLVADACPHRGASMFFGRNEDNGLRCVYHGWKFDVEGNCVDMPSEPSESNFKSKVKAHSYPCIERGGLVWTYMGPRETPPPLPDLEPNMLTSSVTAGGMHCNWLQAMENNLDTVHWAFLHAGSIEPDSDDPALAPWINYGQELGENFPNMLKYRAANFLVKETEFGASSAAQRQSVNDEDSYYWRLGNWHFPFYTQHPGGPIEGKCWFVAVVPVDDTYTIKYAMLWPAREGERNSAGVISKDRTYTNGGSLLPNSTDWLGRFRPSVTMATDMNIDREVQRSDKTVRGYTGIPNVVDQDRGITESQGAPQDRSIEHLATTDKMLILVRRRLLDAVKALRDEGTVPPGVDSPYVYRQRTGSFDLPKHLDPWEATKDSRESFQREQIATTVL